jgi:hypothetical protein
MFIVAFLFGFYSYLIFSLGIAGVLYREVIILLTVAILFIAVYFKRKFISNLRIKKPDKLFFIVLLLFVLQLTVNVIGALGPELAFDALWYHLTLPKIYLLNHSVFFIPGGLLYYSAMPKLAEMLYIGGLAFGNEVSVKLVHFTFGFLVCLSFYKFQRKFFTPFLSLLGVLILYSNLVFAWESTTAYIDLVRTFFEMLSLWAFINWWQSQNTKWFYICAAMCGFAIATKLLAIGSLFIFSLLILYHYFYKREYKTMVQRLINFWFISLLIPLPWFIFSFINTGNPVYPFFSNLYPVSPVTPNIFQFFMEVWKLFTQASDPISPLYIMLLPLLIVEYKKFKKETKVIAFYSFLAILVWYITPRTGGGRFILPYLPAFSFLCVAVLNEVLRNAKRYTKQVGKFIISLIFLIAVITLGYRLLANTKYMPVVFHTQTKHDFLSNNLNFDFGDFYDVDGYFKKHITEHDRVLLYGFHNLYYVDFPFIDVSYVKKGDSFTYIATQHAELPERFKNWRPIYQNAKIAVKLYKPPDGLCSKVCYY